MGAMRPRRLVPALLAAILAGAAAGDDGPAPLGAWGPAGRGPPGPGEPPQPIELEVAPQAPFERHLRDLAGKGRWGDAAELLAQASQRDAFGAILVRGAAPGALVSAREEARRRLHRLPPAALAAYRDLADPPAEALLATRGPRRAAALRELLARYDASSQAPAAARLLGEEALEGGDVAGAILLWRLALARDADPKLRLRLAALRSYMGVHRPGSLSGGPGVERSPWKVRWARRAPGGGDRRPRPVAADGARVYLTDHEGVLAVDRRHGLLKWRVALRGSPLEERLALARRVLVVLQPDRLVGLRGDDGALLWEKAVPDLRGGDAYLDVVAGPVGFVALASIQGRRVLQGWTDDGRQRFETELWAEPAEPFVRWVAARQGPPPPPRAVPAPGGAVMEDPPYEPHRGEPGRVALGDGRVATVGDRAIVSVDGMLAAASIGHGGLIWLQQRCPGREVAGDRILTTLAAGPYAVEAVTGAGHLVRLDPLDGRVLSLPRPPWAKEREPEPGAEPADLLPTPADERPYVLTAGPLVCLYDKPAWGGYVLTRGADAGPFSRLALGPLGPGVVHGDLLALPDLEGVLLFDLEAGVEVQAPVPWALGPGPLVSAGGLLFATAPDGIAVLGPATGSPAKPTDPGDDPRSWIAALDAVDWRARLTAQRKLLALDEREALPLLEAAAVEAATLDGRDQARELVDRVRRRRLFRSLDPRLAGRALSDLVSGVDLVPRLGQLRDRLPIQQGGSAGLSEYALEVEDLEVRYALFEILVRIDAKLRDRLAQAVADPDEDDALRSAAALSLVETATNGGPLGPLERVLRQGEGTEFVFQAAFSVQDQSVLQRLIPLVRDMNALNGRMPLAPDGLPELRRAVAAELPRLLPRR